MAMFGLGKKKEVQPQPVQRKPTGMGILRDTAIYGKNSMRELSQDIRKNKSKQSRSNL